MKRLLICVLAFIMSIFLFNVVFADSADLYKLPLSRYKTLKAPLLKPKSSLSKVQGSITETIPNTRLKINVTMTAGNPKNVSALTDVAVYVMEIDYTKESAPFGTFNLNNTFLWYPATPFIPQSKTFNLTSFKSPRPVAVAFNEPFTNFLKNGDKYYVIGIYGNPSKLCVANPNVKKFALPSNLYFALVTPDPSQKDVLAIFAIIADGTPLQLDLLVTDNLSANIYTGNK